MALSDDIRQLTEIAIFRLLEPESLRLLAFAAETKLLRPDDVLFREGDESDGAFFVVRGGLAIRADANRTALAVSAPALLGELALITPTHRPATATATEHTTVRYIPRTLFHRVLEESPTGASKIRAMIAGRIAAYADDLDRFAKDGG